jgi:competence protein ComGF
LYPEHTVNSRRSTIKKQIKKWAKDMNRYFHKEIPISRKKLANNHRHIIPERNKIEIYMIYHVKSMRITVTKKTVPSV